MIMSSQDAVGEVHATFAANKEEVDFRAKDISQPVAIPPGPATVEFSYRQLFAMRQFENTTLEGKLSLTCQQDAIPAAFEECKRLLKEAVTPEVKQLLKIQEDLKKR
jgi:hypothetical protein